MLIGFVSLAIASFRSYAGSWFILATFHICFLALIVLIFPRPRLYVYTFFAGFFFLGFWPKVIAHTVWAIAFVEPTGDFAGTAKEWDNALLASIAGAGGAIAVRLLYLHTNRASRAISRQIPQLVPVWFVKYRLWIWGTSMGLVILLNICNLYFSFYQVGVNPKVILPFRLNVPIAWLINIGFTIWLAAMLNWEIRLGGSRLAVALGAPIIEAFLSSVSSFSRLTYLLHLIPYVVALSEKWQNVKSVLRNKAAALVTIFIFFFALSFYAVFWLRVNIYYPIEHETSISSEIQRTMAKQIPNLFIHRWIGLEGVLAVQATPGLGKELFVEAILTNPKLGAQTLYQRISKVYYLSENPEKFTFLANSGVIALLLFSGSLGAVFLGLAFITALLCATEISIKNFLDNDLLRSIAGASLANVVAQTTFPYLTFIFIVQLWIAITFLILLERTGRSFRATEQ